MSSLAVTFADPEALEIDYLKARFATRSESYKPATITTAFPATTLTATTHVQVELELGGADDYPITERAQVRVTCYAAPGKRSDVKALASLTQALIANQPGSASIAGTKILVGRSNVITDPDTKNLMAWFLARVNMLPTMLTGYGSLPYGYGPYGGHE